MEKVAIDYRVLKVLVAAAESMADAMVAIREFSKEDVRLKDIQAIRAACVLATRALVEVEDARQGSEKQSAEEVGG